MHMNEKEQFKPMHHQNVFAQNNGVEFDMTTRFRLANPCQNKESKQDFETWQKETKEMLMNASFQHVALFWNAPDSR